MHGGDQRVFNWREVADVEAIFLFFVTISKAWGHNEECLYAVINHELDVVIRLSELREGQYVGGRVRVVVRGAEVSEVALLSDVQWSSQASEGKLWRAPDVMEEFQVVD